MPAPQLQHGLILQPFGIVPEGHFSDDAAVALQVDHPGFSPGGDVIAQGYLLGIAIAEAENAAEREEKGLTTIKKNR